MSHSHDPLNPHSHEPHPEPPSADSQFTLRLPGQPAEQIDAASLAGLPRTQLRQQMILSTGHPATGPFDFAGVTLLDFLSSRLELAAPAFTVEVVSGDGFGTRVQSEELLTPDPAGPILLADSIDGGPMSRRQGLVRLLVPSEKDDALRQVKWIGEIRVIHHD